MTEASVAIVGIGGIYPDAPDPAALWQLVLAGKSAARQVPDGRWLLPVDRAYAPEPGPDRVYSRTGCFIDGLPPLEELAGLALDPELAVQLDPLVRLLLHAGKRAFDDAVTSPLDRSRIGVVVGNLALPSESSAILTRNLLGKTFEEKLLGRALGDHPDTHPLNRYPAGLPAGILAHALGLGGGSATLDAACASSLYAIKLAMDELLAGRADAMLTGGVSRPDPLFTQMGFSQLRALSKRGICSPFDAAGDGLVVGEGAGIFLLKRTADAVAHGDRIYGVIRGVGLANDVGGSLLAPSSEGQLRAMHAAYRRAGWDPRDLDLIECHATGTPVGDAVEVASLRELWANGSAPSNRCVIGSVKSNIGHLLTAAGAAALTKVLWAMNEGVLPPTANFAAPQKGMELEASPFRVLTAPEPWRRRGERIPRRAGVSAFGFGGINAHLLVEEWLPERSLPSPLAGEGKGEGGTPVDSAAVTLSPTLPHRGGGGNTEPVAVVGLDARFGPWQSLRSFQERVLGGNAPCEPTPPPAWWGAESSSWFREEGLSTAIFAGHYMPEVALAPDRFRIPPKELEEMLPQQLLMLRSAAAALADAGIDRDGNLQAGVFVGIALDLNSTNFSFRWSIAERAEAWARELGLDLAPDEMEEWIGQLRDAAGPPLTANRTMGALGSIVASRVAREFRCGGPSFTFSSEESSGIRALEAAVRLLRAGEIDRALVGAVDLAGDLRATLGHHRLRPYSANGASLPFGSGADGAVPGEGAAAVVLKRLSDAERDNDRIYGVIRGIGAAHGGLVTPDAPAVRSAMERACADAGVPASCIHLLESSASGVPAGDTAEATGLAACFGTAELPRRSIAVAALAGEIGHCGAAAGLASLVRGCLALHREILPPVAGAAAPLAQLDGSGPLFLAPTPRYWLRNRADGPRRAGVSVASVDGSTGHVLLEGYDRQQPEREAERIRPLGPDQEWLFTVAGESLAELRSSLALLEETGRRADNAGLEETARTWQQRQTDRNAAPRAVSLVARNGADLADLAREANRLLAAHPDQPFGSNGSLPLPLRERLFYAPAPLGPEGKLCFVFPGSGNHFPGMGQEISCRWPGIFRRQDSENRYLRRQFPPESFWNGRPTVELDEDHTAVIFGQVALGTVMGDLVRSFGVRPTGALGYSLGETAGLFSLGAWRDRDGMLARMEKSTLFTADLAGECRAARLAWGLPEGKPVEWSIGVVDAPAREVRRALRETPRVYLLIVNTPDECVIGGDAKGVKRLVAMLDCRFFPLKGVTTVHCEVAAQVADAYRNLHLQPTTPPDNVTFYSGAKGGSYTVTRESSADAILAQALEGIDYPATVESAYRDGFRLFLEMGPGASCSRMIGRILGDRPHLARSVSPQGQEGHGALLRLLATLSAERMALDLAPLFAAPPAAVDAASGVSLVRVRTGGAPFEPPRPVRHEKPAAVPPPPPVGGGEGEGEISITSDGQPDVTLSPTLPHQGGGSNSSTAIPAQETTDPLLRQFAAARAASLAAHDAYLRFSNDIFAAMAGTLTAQLALLEHARPEELAAAGDLGTSSGSAIAHPSTTPPPPPLVGGGRGEGDAAPLRPVSPCVFDREMCFEFAIGSVGKMLGPQFAEADRFPTRVRLPDEPLMLVDRITALEGEPRSMTNGRVVTEHDILPKAWYLDGGRIPTCIAVEAGQADLFLSGYLGIDFITRGLAVYRLLDAVVTFHRGLPGPGETISYDIRIERFFRQGDTWLFRFFFEATVNGEPLLSMRDGCAGFFSAAELEAGKGIVRPALDLRPTSGTRPSDWVELVPMAEESYDARKLAALRAGDLAGCFGPLFRGLPLQRPLTIPGGRMELVHRVTAVEPRGGRYGEGFIRAEADIHPDDWFITCHFVDDRVMPGTLMYECCMHTLRIFLLRMGWVAESDGAVFEPVPGVASGLRCRGQVLETTKVVTYEVTIRELGYRPEPFVICDALMYADGKPIVEITNMSARLTGTTKEQLLALWQRKSLTLPLTPSHQGRGDALAPSPLVGEGRGEGGYKKPAIYTKEQILAYSNGNPSEGFGDRYRIFDAGMGRKIARLPGPPFQFMDRVTEVVGEPWQMKAGARVEAQYDIPSDEWYFAADRQPRMPFSVLLEAALQPCGWLAAYVGSALQAPVDISFRNLGGTAMQHRAITPESGTLTCTAHLKKVATSGGMIIQEFDFTVQDRFGMIYEGETMFGFFSREALANQVGIRDAKPYLPSPEETGRGRSLDYPANAPFPEKQLRMIDTIELFVPDGGPAGLGYLRGIKIVDPAEWYFAAHFYEDPVTPGSLGLESFEQLLKFAAVERWGWREGDIFEAAALGATHRWLYRGQIVPTNHKVTVEAWITAVDDARRVVTGAGFLSVDGKTIYQMNDFTVRISGSEPV